MSESTMTLAFRLHHPSGYERVLVEILNPFRTTDVELTSSYPHTTVTLTSSDGRIVVEKAAIIAAQLGAIDFDPEVLYVGQSFGTAGERNVINRLKSHSTLLAIYDAAQRETPDQEVWLVLARFDENRLTVINGAFPFQVSEQENDDHMRQVLENPVSEKQQVAFTEAALIRYFQPRYNAIYRSRFPSPEHKTYRECYTLDLNLVAAEIQTFDIPMRLWSAAAAPAPIHFASFQLHSPDERRALFDFFDPMSGDERSLWHVRKARRGGYHIVNSQGRKVGYARSKLWASAFVRTRQTQ